MSWDKLADRCQLFTDAHKGMLIELLKEAQSELTRSVNIVENIMWIEPNTVFENVIVLPNDYKSIISVLCNGNALEILDQSNIYRDSNNAVGNGSPSGYWIKGNRLYFNTNPTTEKIRIEYYAIISDPHTTKFFNLQLLTLETFPGGFDIIGFGTTFTTELEDYHVRITPSNGLWIDNQLGIFLSRGDNYNQLSEQNILDSGGNTNNSTAFSIYNFLGDLGDAGEPTDFSLGDSVAIRKYGVIAPIIPSQYHKDLCDYAIAIASAKSVPELHKKHWLLWLNNIEKIKNEDADRELIFTIRREI